MTSDVFNLEYEVKLIELSAYWLRLPWVRRLAAVNCLFIAVIEGVGERWWLTFLWLILSAEIWFRQRILPWLLGRLAVLSKRPIRVRVETDHEGLRVDYQAHEKTSPIRYWWSRLSDVKDDEFGVMLLFDRNWSGLLIPHRAFESDEQQQGFLELVKQHLVQTQTVRAR